jgi:hypothetical protein
MEEEQEKEEKSRRVNIRIPIKQYQRMMSYGEVLGLDTDTAVLKHFINLGLQFGGASLASQISSDTSLQGLEVQQRMVNMFQTMMDQDQQKAEQTDLVEQADKQAAKPASRGRA